MIAIDTTILVYAEGINDRERYAQARTLLASLRPDRVIIPAQVLGELFRVLTAKTTRSAEARRRAMLFWRDAGLVTATNLDTVIAAADLSTAHNLQIWDAIILQSAAEGGARVLLSEDMHAGFSWSGLTVVNPFAPGVHASMLAPYMR
jgi:predicted nucleic acid-binding protein